MQPPPTTIGNNQILTKYLLLIKLKLNLKLWHSQNQQKNYSTWPMALEHP